jgi:hypothetical protein
VITITQIEPFDVCKYSANIARSGPSAIGNAPIITDQSFDCHFFVIETRPSG